MAGILILDNKADRIKTLSETIRTLFPDLKIYSGSDYLAYKNFTTDQVPDAIILGEFNHSQNRVDICRKLKQQNPLSTLSIIFLVTGREDRETRKNAMEAGADAFLSIPIDEIELRAVLGIMIKLSLANQLNKEALNKKSKEDTADEQEVIASRISMDAYRNLIGHLPQRIFIKDLNSVYISCNEKYARDLGITPEQIAGKDDFAFHPEKIANRYQIDDQEVICSGQPKIIDEPYFIKGKEHWVHINKIPHYDDNNNIVGVIGIFEDITERRNTEEELKVSEFKFRDIYGQCH